MRGLAILLGYALLGNAIRALFALPISGNVIGLILLVVSLFAGWVKLAWIEDTAQFLLKHMMIFFAPVIVGTIVFFGTIGAEWLSVTVALIGGTVVVLVVTGLATAWQSAGEKERSND